MAESSPLQLVSDVGGQLYLAARPNKDSLTKSLRRAANALSQIEQPSSLEASKKLEAVKKVDAAVKPLKKSIVKHGLLRHSDKDVKLLVAICVSEIFRILAPEPPFEDKYLRDVFKLIISMFADLGDTNSPYFSRRVKILETVAQCKCCVIMLDIDCNDLVLDMFNIFFFVVRENHQQSLINDILSIITHILNEEASQQLLNVILRNLVKEGKAAPPPASQLAVSVIQTCAERLEPFVCGFLTSCSMDRDSVDNELKEFYHEILFKIFQCAPQMLIAVIPSLTQELLTDQVDIRIKAVNLVGKLLALPGRHAAQKYLNLFIEFKNRFSDKSVEVRLNALQCAKACYMANPSGKESCEILSAIEGRLLDFDDRVRTQALVVACDLARSNLQFFPPELILKITDRLRDKKISVRKKALQKLMEIYQEYCNKCYEGHTTLSDHYEQISCKVLMLCFDKDCKEFRPQNMEIILAEDLFPVGLSVEERTRHWIHMFSLFTPLHVKAFNFVLNQKQRLQTEMRNFLAARKKEKGNSSEEMQERMKNSFVKMSASFLDPSKAEECFDKLNQMKDNNIFNALELLLDERTIVKAQTTRDKFLKMIGEKHPHIEFLRLLTSKCSVNIFSSEHVRCILDHLSNGFANVHLESCSAKLLLAIISIFPSFLRGSEVQFRALLQENSPIEDVLIEILAKAGPHISVKISDFYPLLERICLEGTRVQSKHAVSAIASLINSSDQFIFSKLCKTLVDSLYSGRKTPTVLQALGCIAQHCVLAFETQYENIRLYFYKEILQVVQFDDPNSSNENLECCDSCKLKIYGLKMLVKSYLPHQRSHFKRKVDELLEILSQMLQAGNDFDGYMPCLKDKPHIKLAAAKAVLKLSRRWDLHISPEIFRFTVLMAKDESSFVKRSILYKTHKLLKEHAIPCRYACAFALAAYDCREDLQDASTKYMEEFIKEYTKNSQIRQASAMHGLSLTDYPAYVIVYLIHVLGHDTGFPPEDSQDEELYAQFCSPLFWVIQAFLNATIVNGDVDLVKETTVYLLSIFRAIKRAEDAVDAQQTPKLHILAEIGISIISALNHDGISSPPVPGQILLPSSLYRIIVKQCDRVNLRSLTRFPVDQNLIKRVIRVFYSQISVTVTTLTKRGRKYQEDGVQSADIKFNMLNRGSHEHAELLTAGTTEMKKITSKEVKLRSRQKRALAPIACDSVGLYNEHSVVEADENYASKISKPIQEKEQLSSSFDPAAMKPSSNESQVSIQSVEVVVPSLKENAKKRSHSKCTKSNPKEPCSTRELDSKKEALVGKRIRLLSPVDRCFYSGTVVDFNLHNNTHKISYDCGDVELLCLDSESWETENHSSLEEMVLIEFGYDSISSLGDVIGQLMFWVAKHLGRCIADLRHSRINESYLQSKQQTADFLLSSESNMPFSSQSSLQETGDTCGDDAAIQKQDVACKESKKQFAAKGKKGVKGQKVFSDKSASEVINVNKDAVVRRTRRKKA